MVEHVDPEVLALVALGEPASDADRAHLDRCARCADEVASLAATVAVGRAVRPTDAPVPPAPAVWDRIRDELGLTQDTDGGAAARLARGTPGTAGELDVGGAGSPGAARPAAVAPVVPLRRRVVPWAAAAAAAAAGVVLGGAAGAWWTGRDTAGDAAEVVASAALDPLPGWDAGGRARVEVDAAGDRTLVVQLEGTGADQGFHEVWLIDRDVTRLVSVGILTGGEGRFTVPPGLDLDEFPVVDVSDEPYDGDPAHSGDSIIRGVLDV